MTRANGSRTRRSALSAGILIDQGLGDAFLAEQRYPEVFEAACHAAGQLLTLRRHASYDHGCYFSQSFIADHLAHHAKVRLA
jgi:S-formylglutathione hydrolase